MQLSTKIGKIVKLNITIAAILNFPISPVRMVLGALIQKRLI